LAMLSAAGTEKLPAAGSSSMLRWPNPIGSPVLESLRPVIEHSRDVRTHVDKIAAVADWMAYEELPLPEFVLPFGIGKDPSKAIDFILVCDTIDFAFTDFSTHVKFQTDYAGRSWSDSEALFACMKRALDDGVPVLEGSYLAQATREKLTHIFRGN